MADGLNAQRAVLGSLLIDPQAVAGIVFSSSREEDFTGENRTLYTAARALHADARPIDPVILEAQLGEEYAQLMRELMAETPTAANVEEYLGLVREGAQRRRLQAVASEIALHDPALPRCRELIAEASLILSDDRREDAVSMQDMLNSFFDRHASGQKRSFLPWGFRMLDKHLCTELGDFVIIGGYPSAGKSMMSVQVALTMARAGYKVGYFSLETEPRTKLADRILCHEARVPLPKIKANDLSEADMAALMDAAQQLHRLDVDFFRAGGYSLADIQARTLAKGYQVILVDYLQLIRAEGRDLREQVTAVSMGLHTLAQKHGICVIALSQLSRPDKEGGKPKRPTMSSLRESGQLEQDADAVLLLYSENPEDRSSPRRLQIAKSKESGVDSCLLDFDGPLQSLKDQRESWKDMPRKPKGRVNPEWAAAQAAEIPGQSAFEELGDGEGDDLPF